MAIDMGAKTLVEGTGCLYGSNLLTLCLQISTPPEFMEKLMSMIKEKSSHYLNLPDASGRTPLYIAVDQENEAQIRRLLEAGATPNTPCKFAAEGLTLTTLQAGSSSASKRQRLNDDPLNSRDNPIPVITAYDHALAKGNHKIFSLLFENLLHSSNWQQGYPIKEDPLQLEKWASLHSETELRTLASQFHGLKSFLFNLKDQSGTSIVERTLVRKEPLDSDVTPLFCKDPALGAIYAAAVSADITSFIHRLGTYLCPPSDASTITHAETLLKLFLEYCDPADIDHLYNLSLESKPLMQNVIGQTYHSLKLPFDKFAVLAKLMWPILKESEREFIVSQTAAVDARYTELVIQLGGFAMKRNDYAVSQMVKYAPYAANTTAFEFGMAHLDVFDYLNDMMKSQEDPECAPIIRGLVISTIHARSLLWFEKFMAAGLHLQPLIDSDSELILPLIADLHPERLSTWLSGMKYTINDQMIEDTRTSQGRDALLKLIKPEKAATQKTGTGKSDA